MTRPNSSHTGKRRKNRARGAGPPALDDAQREACETVIGYRFKDARLLDRAMTHRSIAHGQAAEWSNERLEFLGDRVLGLVAVEALMQRFPTAREGELAPRLNALVSRRTCAEIGASIGLGEHLLVDRSERSTGGAEKPSLLANAMEAVIGAVYLDGGLDKARKLVLRLWAPLFGELREAPRDPKSALQEWAQGAGLATPVYQHGAPSGPDHAPTFTATVMVEGRDPAEGAGPSKQHAEREAARRMLARIGSGT